VSGFSHLGGALAALLVALPLLLYLGRGNLAKEIVLLVYGVCLTLMFSASAVYHLAKSSPAVIPALRKFDHSAIYLLIAGTYTPICFHFFRGAWQWGMLAVIWTMAIIGVAVKIYFIRAPRWLTAGIYLVMGWMGILGIQQILLNMPVAALVWLLLGGVFFTLGAVVYITKILDFVPGVFGFHEVWHIFVILGALCHYILIAAFVAAS
jgi:hemolysin III